MYRLYWEYSNGTRAYAYQFPTETQALTARWNWAQRGSLYKIETPTGDTL